MPKLKEINREDVLEAIYAFDNGQEHDFGESKRYYLIHEGKPYPPKAIIGIAAKRIYGRPLSHSEFKSGEAQINRLLRKLGFSIVTKSQFAKRYSELPENPTSNIWLENTKSFYRHGGKGWEFGTCLWSPSRARDGKDIYAAMRDAKPGDLVIHVNDSVLTGYSYVSTSFQSIDEEPPHPGSWKGMGPFYRVDLEKYTPFPRTLPLSSFLYETKEEIREDIRTNKPFKYPFYLEKSGKIKPVQGGYLTKCTPGLYKLIRYGISKEKIVPEDNPETRELKEKTPYLLDQAMQDLFISRDQFEQILDSFQRKNNIILQGPPGVGKSFLARRIAYALIGFEEANNVQMIQFHQSYSYEDFVQGWRPDKTGQFQLKKGLFYRFCEKAKADPAGIYVLVVDEINRGNLSKILGELMLLIEYDKRGPENAIPLTYFEEGEAPFYVPENLYLLGLMNTADRSLAMVDYALRRRFVFFDIKPEFESDSFKSYLQQVGVTSDVISKIIFRMSELNRSIYEDHKNLGPGFAIGHSFFCPKETTISDCEEWYRCIIKTEIAPLLREYYFDNPEEAESLVENLLK